MKIVHLPLISTAVGILLVGLSFAWPAMIKRAVWDDHRARQRAEASADVHRLSHVVGHAADRQHPDEGQQTAGSLEEAKQRFQRSNAMLQRARSYRQWTATLLRWMGAACTLLGAGSYFALVRAADG